jgi:hypothetical protein
MKPAPISLPTLPSLALSDGRTAQFIRKARAGDASKAHRIAGPKGNDIDRSAALLAQIVQIDGAGVTMEDLLQLDLDDFNAVSEAMPGKPSGPSPEA